MAFGAVFWEGGWGTYEVCIMMPKTYDHRGVPSSRSLPPGSVVLSTTAIARQMNPMPTTNLVDAWVAS